MPDPGQGALGRAKGALLGLAVGDALGAPAEFRERGAFEPVTGMAGGGAHGLEPGQWTDDTSMALCLAESILERDGVDPRDLMDRFVDWWRNGANSSTGECFDIGATTEAALARYLETGDPLSGSDDPGTAGNGSLMRLAPVAIAWAGSPDEAAAAARRQSRTTHGAAEAVDACALLAGLLAEAISGAPREAVLRPRRWEGAPGVGAVAAGGWRGKGREGIRSDGYAVHTLEAALWAVGRGGSFGEALLAAVNLGHDADTVGAVTGQLAGALWGVGGIPGEWLAALAWRDRIERLAEGLFRRGRDGGP